MYKTAIGQDSHRFVENNETTKELVLGGYMIPDCPGLKGNSDADVILHSITNAISGITGRNILGPVSDEMCRNGVTDSAEYLRVALNDLNRFKICHVSISLECSRPKILPHIVGIKQSVAGLLGVSIQDIGLTATSGEGLTDFGKGLGIQCFVILSVTDETDDLCETQN